MNRVYIAVINDLATDQRIHRVASLLTGLGFQVTCIGRELKRSPELGNPEFRAKRYRMLFNKGPLFYACFNVRLFLTLLLVKRPSLFIANDLDTLPAAYAAGRIRGVKLIFDSHELFTQVPELIHRKRVQRIWKGIEALLVPRIRVAVTVSYPIAEIYRRLYGVRFSVVRNVPFRLPHPPERILPDELEGWQLVIYQGALNVGRGIELMIETMKYLDNVVLIIAGSGDIETRLHQMAAQCGVTEKVQFRGRLSPQELIPLTRICDLGVSLEEDLGLNYRYALPNKIFDYIQARIPVLCSALPEMKRIVEAHGVGISTGERDPEKLAAIIRYMLDERSSGMWMDALERAAGLLCWENESRNYVELLTRCGLTG